MNEKEMAAALLSLHKKDSSQAEQLLKVYQESPAFAQELVQMLLREGKPVPASIPKPAPPPALPPALPPEAPFADAGVADANARSVPPMFRKPGRVMPQGGKKKHEPKSMEPVRPFNAEERAAMQHNRRTPNPAWRPPAGTLHDQAVSGDGVVLSYAGMQFVLPILFSYYSRNSRTTRKKCWGGTKTFTRADALSTRLGPVLRVVRLVLYRVFCAIENHALNTKNVSTKVMTNAEREDAVFQMLLNNTKINGFPLTRVGYVTMDRDVLGTWASGYITKAGRSAFAQLPAQSDRPGLPKWA